MTRQEQKKEAMERIKALQLYENVLNDFQKEEVVNLSESGFLYWLNDEQKEAVKKFEEEYHGLVYHVIHSFTGFGELLSMLYVSATSEEWEMDREDIKNGRVLAYVDNLNEPLFSEIGYIEVIPVFGGLVRIS